MMENRVIGTSSHRDIGKPNYGIAGNSWRIGVKA